MSVIDLVREDLRDFAGYSSARKTSATGSIWLNANESPWRSPADATGEAVHRYPEPQPGALRTALARLYGVPPEQLLIGRGSDEGIDLLIRALCRPQRDAVLVTSPVFGMYAVCARVQGAPLVDVPLRDTDQGFVCDLDAVANAALQQDAKIVFLCSPGNPTGQLIPAADIRALAARLCGRAVVVVDEAYIEYSDAPSLASEVTQQANLAVLRTLSKAHALAAARIGCLIAAPELIAVLRSCQAPYPVPAPSARLALAALQSPVLARTAARVATIRRERERVLSALHGADGVRRVYASEGNFLLARFADADAALRKLHAAGVVVRDMRAQPALQDALRISTGDAAENDALLAALGVAISLPERSLSP